jgi:hypothetical protein
MALAANIGGNGTLFIGEDKTFTLELINASNVPVDMTPMTIVFVVSLKDNSTTQIFNKPASLTGVYNIVRAVNTQRAVVTLSDVEMNTLKARTYRHSWKAMNALAETVLAWGNFAPQKATAP